MTAAADSSALDPALVAAVRDDLLEHSGPVTSAAVAAAVRRTGRVVGAHALLELVARISAQLGGAGPLQPLLDEPGVTDVFVNGPRSVFADRGAGLEPVDAVIGSEADLRSLAVRLASLGGRRLDDSAPLVDVRLPDGVRLNAVIPPLSGETTVMSFRIPRRRSFTLAELAAGGFVPPELVEVLDEVLERRANFLISGGTGSGKTALLGAMLAAVGADQRIILVEDSRELVVDHPHIVQLAARQANAEGSGEVPMSALVRNALRMRPDRLVVGECRGAEVRDMLTALNTGHEGGCATLHANTSAAVPARLEALGALAGMTPEAVTSQAATAIDVIIHITRSRTAAAPSVDAPPSDGEREDSADVHRADTGGRGIVEVGVPVLVGRRLEVEAVWERGAGFSSDGVDRLRETLAGREAR